jgi:hypothetical protein
LPDCCCTYIELTRIRTLPLTRYENNKPEYTEDNYTDVNELEGGDVEDGFGEDAGYMDINVPAE